MMLLTAIQRPERIVGLVGVAAAPDFTEDLMWLRFGDGIKKILRRDGVYREPSIYGDEPYTITLKLIEEGRDHLILRSPLPIHVPIRLLHGMADPDVPYQVSVRVAEHVCSTDVQVHLIKNGDHRLSTDKNLGVLIRTVETLLDDSP